MERCALVLMLLVTLALVSPLHCAAPKVATIAVDVDTLGRLIPRDFDGFSIEVDDAAQKYLGTASFPNLVFLQLLKNLGNGTIRIGGASQDYSCWNPEGAPQPQGCIFVITSDVVQGFFKASAATGWPVIVGINLAQNSAEWALQYGIEVVNAARAIPGSQLMGFEFGNEPDLFASETHLGKTTARPAGYGWRELVKDWRSYVSAFKGNPTTAGVPLVGPAYDSASELWRNSHLEPFLDGLGQHDLGIATVHAYPTDTCNGHDIQIADILTQRIMDVFEQQGRGWVQAANSRGFDLQLDETNSTACAGKQGVDDAFASALWGLDWLFTSANIGFRRINLHMDNAHYSAVFVTPTRTSTGVTYANRISPLYYAMYLFTHAINHRILPTAITSTANIKAYAVRSSSVGPVKLFVINKDLSAFGTVGIAPSRPMHQASLLILEAPALGATSGVTYGGQAFDNNTGTLSSPQTMSLSPDANGKYSFHLPNAAAALLTINP
jgi:hypothetical protein